MANQVFANGREVACKAGAGKTIASFPDVCMTPPENPATPPGVPVPYPNTGFASDTTSGTKNIKISDKEVGIKNKSYFKTSTGDEAGCAAKKGVKSSKNKGKVYFTSWSSDVKFEGKNVIRHLDTTTNNHGSNANEALPWPFLDTMAITVDGTKDPCKKQREKVKKKCSKHIKKTQQGKIKRKESIEAMCDDPKCKSAMKCVLQPHQGKKEYNNCCDGKTTHHLVPSAEFISHAQRGKKDPVTGYSDLGAPCLCVSGDDHNDPTTEHGKVGRKYKRLRAKAPKPIKLSKAIKMGAESATAVGCPKDCTEAQLKRGHRQMKLNVKESDPVPRQKWR